MIWSQAETLKSMATAQTIRVGPLSQFKSARVILICNLFVTLKKHPMTGSMISSMLKMVQHLGSSLGEIIEMINLFNNYSL